MKMKLLPIILNTIISGFRGVDSLEEEENLIFSFGGWQPVGGYWLPKKGRK
jgi:hypothetical protein